MSSGIGFLRKRLLGVPALTAMALMWACTARAWADESSLNLPNDFDTVTFGGINGVLMLKVGLAVCVLGGLFGLWQYTQVKNLPAHKSMLEISAVIYETCKTYLFQQGKFLAGLWVAIAICMTYYFLVLRSMPFGNVVIVLIMSIVGILGSCGVAWFGIRINTLANSRTAFSSLRGKPFPVYAIPLQSGMSIGMLLVCVELIMMLIIMLFLPRDVVGPSFIGFAIGESLGASVLRICGGIFTKIADIGSDLMKIVFNIKEDDARNPGVIADCTGDNAGDSVGPTADGFETYGVTGVALIVFIVLAFAPQYQSAMIIWIFVMRILMIVTSLVSFFINDFLAKGKYANADKMDFEGPLTVLVWLTSLISIAVTYGVSYFMLADFSGVPEGTWWKLASIISCGTLAAAVIPELTKVFTSASSAHVAEIVSSSREGGASLTILSGMVAGNFSAFWMGITIAILMGVAYMVSLLGLSPLMGEGFATYISVFAFGLVAFGFLGMGPVTIAVDSYGPVTDNAQSVYELSLIEQVPDVHNVIEKEFGFKPDFDHAKHFLEENDGAGNTFKATAKPVLIGTAVVGATTMIFSIILLLKKKFGIEADTSLNLVAPMNILGLACGGAVVSWFCGASMQAVTTGAYRAVEFIKANIKLDMETTKANVDDSRKVVQICTEFAQKGMINIFIVIFCLALSFAMLNPYFFVAYLMSIALFGLFNAIYMANAGGSWDNAKKVVEVELKEKGTPLHAATVVGDTVGDPYKDTSSVALNPIIKFTTLFGLLAVEIAVDMDQGVAHVLSLVFFLIALVFVWRSFYAMRIGSTSSSASASSASPEKEMAAATH